MWDRAFEITSQVFLRLCSQTQQVLDSRRTIAKQEKKEKEEAMVIEEAPEAKSMEKPRVSVRPLDNTRSSSSSVASSADPSKMDFRTADVSDIHIWSVSGKSLNPSQQTVVCIFSFISHYYILTIVLFQWTVNSTMAGSMELTLPFMACHPNCRELFATVCSYELNAASLVSFFLVYM